MKRVLTAAVLIPFVLLLVFWAPTWIVGTAIIVIGFQAIREYLDIAEGYGKGVLRGTTFFVWTLLSILILFESRVSRSDWFRIFEIPIEVLLAASPICLLFLTFALRRNELTEAFPSAAMSMVSVFWIMVPLACLVGLHAMPGGGGWFLLTFLFLVVWTGDISAYYVGRSIGKKPLAPIVSPKKTWEGAIASTVFGGILGSAWFYFAPNISQTLLSIGLISKEKAIAASAIAGSKSLITGLVLALVVNIAAQFGDLTESMLKRGAGTKDSGSILPGHGGILDRIDALLFAAPVVWLAAYFAILISGV